MIVILVEGDGEKHSLPVLIQRQLGRTDIRCIDMRGKSNILRRPRGFEDTVRRQHALGQREFVILVDADVTSQPYTSLDNERLDLPQRAQTIAQELNVRVEFHWAVRESESWLIGGIAARSNYCDLRNVGRPPANTETDPADPKAWLQDHLRSD